jgi:lipopolysaccharide export system ATP-binding protein
MTAEPLLEIKSLSLSFGDRAALDQVSLTVWAGEIVGLLDRNGAGKTTLMKTVMGLLSPDAGEIHRRTVMKFLPQESMLPREERETLSGFEVRRLEISRALSAGPGLLLLDEPLSGVDPRGWGSLASWIRELARQGTGVLLCDHNAAEALRLCDRAYVLHEGRILAHGTPKDLSKA